MYKSLIIIFSLLASTANYADDRREMVLESLIIYKIIPYIKWSKEIKSNVFKICVYRDREFYDVVYDQLNGKVLALNKLKPLVIRVSRINKNSNESCNIVTFNFYEYKRKSSRPTFIISRNHHDRFKYHINFLKEKNKIRFNVDLKYAKNDNFTISSKLLRIAKKVIK